MRKTSIHHSTVNVTGDERDAITIDTIRQACAAVLDARGLDQAVAALAKFGATRTNQIKPADYPAFIAECEKAAQAAA